MRALRTLRLAFFVSAASLTLVACAPRPAPALPEAPIRLAGDVGGFYPTATGVEWRFTRPGPGPAEARIRVIGPQTFAGERTIAFEFTSLLGEGLTRSWVFHRRVEAGRVIRVGDVSDQVTNLTRTWEPAFQEHLLGAALRVGARWGGTTTMTERVTQNGALRPTLSIRVEYEYRVVAQRWVTVPAGSFLAYIIEFRASSGEGEVIVQEIWFVPGLGEIRTREGFLLAAFNFDFRP